MTDQSITYPDWEAMSKVAGNPVLQLETSASMYKAKVRELWNDVVSNPNLNNNEVRSMMIQSMDRNETVKLMFYVFLDTQYPDVDEIQWDYRDVLKFFNHASFCNEQYITKLTNGDSLNVRGIK